jgi:hypothetical protein
MDNQDFKAIWQASNKKDLVKFKPDKLSTEIVSKLNKFNKKTKLNVYTEIIVAILMIPFFTYLVIVIPFVLSKIGAGIIATSMFFVIFKMTSSLKKENESIDLPMRDYLLNRKQHLLKQIRIIDTVLYWYILPPGIGVLLFIIGFKTNTLLLILSLTISVVVYLAIYVINKQAVKKYFKPLLKELENCIDELNNNTL